MRFLVLMLFLAAPLGAQTPAERGHDVSGRMAVRLGLEGAPLGIRYFWEPRYGAEAALGFGVGSDSPTRVNLEGGFLYALAPGERVNFFIRPGLGFKSSDLDSVTVTTIAFSLSGEVEFFATDDLSLSGGIGVSVASRSGDGGEDTTFSTFSRFLGRAAVQYYFP